MRANLQVKHTFIGKGGHHIDCVGIDNQPSLRHPLLKNRKVQRIGPKLVANPKHPPGKKNIPIQHHPHHLPSGEVDKYGPSGG